MQKTIVPKYLNLKDDARVDAWILWRLETEKAPVTEGTLLTDGTYDLYRTVSVSVSNRERKFLPILKKRLAALTETDAIVKDNGGSYETGHDK